MIDRKPLGLLKFALRRGGQKWGIDEILQYVIW
jgi:hypothetical protein